MLFSVHVSLEHFSELQYCTTQQQETGQLWWHVFQVTLCGEFPLADKNVSAGTSHTPTLSCRVFVDKAIARSSTTQTRKQFLRKSQNIYI